MIIQSFFTVHLQFLKNSLLNVINSVEILPDAQGVPEDMLKYASKNGVAKINIDTDLRLAMTSTIREFLLNILKNSTHSEYMGPGRTAVKEMVYIILILKIKYNFHIISDYISEINKQKLESLKYIRDF